MRAVKIVVIVAVVGAGGYFAWGKIHKSPEKRACARLAELCDGKGGGDREDDAGDCDDFFSAMRKSAPDAVERTAGCMTEARSCGQAVGCLAGGGIQIGTGFARDFADGLSRSLSH